MLRDWQGRIQDLWVRSPRNRIIIMISTGVVTILVLCGLCNVIGSLTSGILASALTSNPGPKPTTGSGTSQANNFNPTFPLPSPTTYPFPNQGSTPVGSSNTPAPTATKDPRATPTDQPTQPGGGGEKITFQFNPDPNDLKAGQNNQINLQGPPGTLLSISLYLQGNNSCLSMPVTLDATGQGTATCNIPANLQGTNVKFSVQAPTLGYFKNYNIPIL